MKTTLALASLGAVLATAQQRQTEQGGQIELLASFSGPSPPDAVDSYDGKFEINVIDASIPATDRAAIKQPSITCDQPGFLYITLNNGLLTDSENRTGYIASNYQFQFDDPPQHGALYIEGFAVLPNNTLVLGPSALFFLCLSGDFYNIYDRKWAAQCAPFYLEIAPCSDPSSATADNTITTSDGSQNSDGQPQEKVFLLPVIEINDGQVQVPTKAPVPQTSTRQIQAPSAAALVSQTSAAQIQAPSAAALVSQVPDVPIPSTSAAAAKPTSTVVANVTSPYVPISSGNALKGSFASLVLGVITILLS